MSIRNWFNNIYAQNETIDQIAKVVQMELDSWKIKRDQAFYNGFAETADEQGIRDYERILQVIPDTTKEDLEYRRARVLILLSTRVPYTFFYLQRWMDSFVGKGQYEMSVVPNDYLLSLLLPEHKEQYWNLIIPHIKVILPANMLFQAYWQSRSVLKVAQPDNIVSMFKEKTYSVSNIFGGKVIDNTQYFDGSYFFDGEQYFDGGNIHYQDYYLVSEITEVLTAELAFFNGDLNFDGEQYFDGLREVE